MHICRQYTYIHICILGGLGLLLRLHPPGQALMAPRAKAALPSLRAQRGSQCCKASKYVIMILIIIVIVFVILFVNYSCIVIVVSFAILGIKMLVVY